MKITLKQLLNPQAKSKIKAGEGKTFGKYKFFASSPIQSKFVDDAIYDKPALIFGTGGNASVHYCDEPFATSTDCLVMYGRNATELQTIYNYLRSNIHIIENGFKGAGLKHISKEYILDISLEMPDESTQKTLIEKMKMLDSTVARLQEQVAQLDQLVKSRFVEMFGLPGTDVHGWGMSSLGEICEINPKKSQDARLTNGLLVSFVPMPSVSESGDIDATQVKPYDEVKTGFTYFAENDVLFAKITPCMENGKGAIATGLYNGIGFGSTEFHVLRPAKETATPRWIYTLTVFPQFRIDAASNMTGSAGQRRVPASFLENYRVSVPPLELQNRFAAFVTEVDKSKLSYEMEVAA